ncbi:hypothetical protein [Streptomyces parvulus]|uniref:hypothetical protein n=1 Tax=Streptomyces parvulus TaxID=146923 RepID=UPI0033FFEFF1
MINPETGRSQLTELRRLAGGSEPRLIASHDDEVLTALQVWAAENFGGLLLGEGGFSLGWGGSARERMTRAIAADPELPFGVNSNEMDGIWHITSSGSASTVQLASLGSGIVAAAFRQAATQNVSLQLEDVLAEIPDALYTARSLFMGKSVEALALAGLAGVLLPDDKTELTAPWGRVRTTHDTDNVLLAGQQDLLTMAQPDGTNLVSRGTGDLTIETKVSWVSEFGELPTGEEISPIRPPITSYNLLQRRVLEVRLAFALSMADSRAPALLPTWAKVEDPISGTSGFSFTEISKMRRRTPTRLSVEQAQEWERWITILSDLRLDNLGHAPQRLLRAMTERDDPVDALVDAVIVWESIFGTHDEITFRVCGSLARLLYGTVEERLSFVKRAKGIYTMRSKIVHGASDTKPERVNESRDEAVHVAIHALRALVSERPDLLAITTGSRRSDRIMLE